MKALRAVVLSISIYFLFGVSSAISGPYDHLTASQALDELKFNIDMLNETEDALLENADIAEANKIELMGLENERANLDYLDLDYASRVDSHNANVDGYNAQCTTYELDQATYNSCLSWKSSLDYTKGQLDGEAAQLENQFADYNRRVQDYNQREDNRAWAAQQLIRKYDEYSANIRSLQMHLNALAAIENLENFNQRNQDCANRASLEDMHQCMQAIWDGAER